MATNPFRLTKRDQFVLRKIHDFGILSSRQIESLCFRGTASTTVLRRLRKLTRSGLIVRNQGIRGGPLLFCLTPKGARLLGSDLIYGKVNPLTTDHEVTLSSVRIHLECAGAIQAWKPGFELRQNLARNTASKKLTKESLEIIPDAIIVTKTRSLDSISVALELELTAKSKSRYSKIFGIYGKKEGLQNLWYIVPHERLAGVILRAWARHWLSRQRPDFVMVSLIDAVIKDPSTARYQTIRTSELVKNWITLKPVSTSSSLNAVHNKTAQARAHPVSRSAQNQNLTKTTQPIEITGESRKIKNPEIPPSGPDSKGGLRRGPPYLFDRDDDEVLP